MLKYFFAIFSISYISKLTVTSIGSDLVTTNTIFMAVMVFAYTFVQIYCMVETSFFHFSTMQSRNQNGSTKILSS